MRCIWSGVAPCWPLIGPWRPSSVSDWVTQVQDKTMETLEMDGHWWPSQPGHCHGVNICVTCIRHRLQCVSLAWLYASSLTWATDLLTRIKRLVNTFSNLASSPQNQMVNPHAPLWLLALSIICLCSDLMFSWQYCVSASVTWYYCDNIYCGLAALCCGLCVVWSKLISPGSRKLLYRAIEQTVNSVGATITWFLYWSGCSVCVFSSDRNN